MEEAMKSAISHSINKPKHRTNIGKLRIKPKEE
jgi:hypothetical protein